MGERRKTDSRRTPRGVVAGSGANRAGANRAGTDARAVTLTALRRIDEGAYANLVVPAVLEQTHLDPRDRHFVTELAYGVTRMRRALDFVVDGYLHHMPAPEVRRVLRLGAYQLLEMRVPAHAAVDSSVSLAPKAAQGLVNAVLRRVSTQQTVPWPSDAVRLRRTRLGIASYRDGRRSTFTRP